MQRYYGDVQGRGVAAPEMRPFDWRVLAGAVPARSDRMVEALAAPASDHVEAFDRLSPGVVFA